MSAGATHINHKGNGFWPALLVAASGPAITVLGMMGLQPGLPLIAIDLNTSLSETQWVIIGYGLTQTALVPLGGRLADLIDRKDSFLGGLLLFAIGGALGSLAFNVEFIIFARVVQALGSASILATSFALVTDLAPPSQRGLAIGIVVGIIGVGVALALSLGGVIVTHLGWEAAFLAMTGCGMVLLAIGLVVLPRGLRPLDREPIDWLGAATFAATLGALLLAITKGQEWGWASGRILALFGAVPLLALAFLAFERRTSHPVVDLGLFRNPIYAANNLAMLLAFVPLGAFYFLMTFFLQGPQRYSAQETGLILLPLPFGNTLGSLLVGRISHRFSSSALAIASLGFIILGFSLVALADVDSSIPDLLWRIFISGLGIGAFQAADTNLVMSTVPLDSRGSTSGVLNMFLGMGMNVGIAVAGVVLAAVVNNQFAGLGGSLATPRHFAELSDQTERLADLQDAFIDGFGAAFLAVTAFSVLGLLLALFSARLMARAASAALVRGGSPRPADLAPSRPDAPIE